MKHRSLARLAVLDVITVGLYEIVWLIQTRREMVEKYGVKVPRAAFLIATWIIQVGGMLSVIAIVLIFIPANNRAVDKFNAARVHPAAQCYGDPDTMSAECQQQLDTYLKYPPDHSAALIFSALGLVFVEAAADALYLKRWMVPYAVAVERITNQEFSANTVVLTLGCNFPLVGMIFIQKEFNKIGAGNT